MGHHFYTPFVWPDGTPFDDLWWHISVEELQEERKNSTTRRYSENASSQDLYDLHVLDENLYSRLFVRDHHPSGPPGWYVEGLSETEKTRHVVEERNIVNNKDVTLPSTDKTTGGGFLKTEGWEYRNWELYAHYPPEVTPYRYDNESGTWELVLPPPKLTLKVILQGYQAYATTVVAGILPIPWFQRAAEDVWKGSGWEGTWLEKAAHITAFGAQVLIAFTPAGACGTSVGLVLRGLKLANTAIELYNAAVALDKGIDKIRNGDPSGWIDVGSSAFHLTLATASFGKFLSAKCFVANTQVVMGYEEVFVADAAPEPRSSYHKWTSIVLVTAGGVLASELVFAPLDADASRGSRRRRRLPGMPGTHPRDSALQELDDWLMLTDDLLDEGDATNWADQSDRFFAESDLVELLAQEPLTSTRGRSLCAIADRGQRSTRDVGRPEYVNGLTSAIVNPAQRSMRDVGCGERSAVALGHSTRCASDKSIGKVSAKCRDEIVASCLESESSTSTLPSSPACDTWSNRAEHRGAQRGQNVVTSRRPAGVDAFRSHDERQRMPSATHSQKVAWRR